jgi:hypothetical protein
VEIEISAEEGVTVLEAHRNMSGFPYYSTTPRDYPGSPIMFNHSPTLKPSPVDRQYVVYATAELFGVAFSQGACCSVCFVLLSVCFSLVAALRRVPS